MPRLQIDKQITQSHRIIGCEIQKKSHSQKSSQLEKKPIHTIQSINQSIAKSINQSINQSVSQSINQSNDWSNKPLLTQPVNQSFDGLYELAISTYMSVFGE